MIGKTLAHYEISGLLGKGGMGEVYRARDTKLDRDVALKLLPQEFARDAERLGRFQREARTLASLSHPNVAPIFGYEEANGERFLVMELIEGEDLSQRIQRGRLAMDEALEIAVQIADGLEAAHEKNIVHRDLKPANVKITPDGQVKLIDFGLARASIYGSGDESDLDHSPTITAAFTQAGTILGTAAYMSPEQARGHTVDKRADIWAFGVILFEMMTGQRLFEGETVSDTLAGILKSSPEWSQLPQQTPPRVQELLDRCLAKRRRDRLRDIGDARLELKSALASEGSPASGVLASSAAPSEHGSRRTVFVVAITMLLVGSAVGAGLRAGLGEAPSMDPTGVNSLSLTLGADRIGTAYPLISPDGSVIAYAERHENPTDPEEGSWKGYIRHLDGFEPRFIENSYGLESAQFSPDGQWLVFMGNESPSSSLQKLYKVRVEGRSPPVALANTEPDWGYLLWPNDDEILAFSSVPPERMVRIAADGSGVRGSSEISKPNDDQIGWASVLPGGRNALCLSVSFSDAGYEWNTSLLDLETAAVRPLLEDAGFAAWSPTGHLLFTRHDNLLAVPFDLETLTVTGGPMAILQDLYVNSVWSDAWFALSTTGTLVYGPGGMKGANRRLATLDPDGSLEEWAPDGRSYGFFPERSPDGEWVAVTGVGDSGLNEIWISRADQRDHRVLVAEPGLDCQGALFDPDSGRIVYNCADSGSGGGLYSRAVDGSDSATRLRPRREGETLWTFGFWPDGTRILCGRMKADGMDIFEQSIDAPFEDGDPVEPIVSGVMPSLYAGLSPDGQWISYLSESSGRGELYLRRYTGSGSVGGEVPVTSSGATAAWWSTDVKEDGTLRLYYRTQDQQFVAVDVSPGTTPQFSRRTLTVVSPILRNARDHHPIGDDRWLVIIKGEEETPLREYRVVTNWTKQLQEVVGAHSN